MSDFIKKAAVRWSGKFVYPNIDNEYKNCDSVITVICLEHGKFTVSAKQHLSSRNKYGCKQCGDKFSKVHAVKSNEKFIEEASKAHNGKFDYSKTKYINNKTKITVICPEHGEFEQFANAHLKYGCRKCAVSSSTRTLEEFIKLAVDKHDDKYDYSAVEYKNTVTKVKIICPEHGLFFKEPVYHLYGQGCPKCANESIGERKISEFLNGININFEREKTFDGCINPKTERLLRFDFYLPKHNVCIEFDGVQHYKYFKSYRYKLNEIQFRDKLKNEFCKNNNIRLLRIKHNEITRIGIKIVNFVLQSN